MCSGTRVVMSLKSTWEDQQAPFVSVVVPVFNSPRRVARCIEALLGQTYPRDRYEIIVVDNGSTDNTPEVIQRYKVELVVEDRIQSPYAARNRGIQTARGELIALIDANCTPIADWLAHGVQAIQTEQADLAGGKVTFTFSRHQTAGELYDSITNVNMEQSIARRGVAKGGNLFVKRRVFDAIGLFPSDLRSGGDVLWTGAATRAGLKLVYAADAEAFYPARKLVALLKKQIRVGRGQIVIWTKQRLSPPTLALRMVKGLLPPSPWAIRCKLHRRGIRAWSTWLAVWLNGWACKLATSLGRIQALTRSREVQR